MKKNALSILWMLALLFVVSPLAAQRLVMQPDEDLIGRVPLFGKMLVAPEEAPQGVRQVIEPREKLIAPRMTQALTGVELWGNLLMSEAWADATDKYGIYSFAPTSPVNFSPLVTGPNYRFMGGVGIQGGKYYGANLFSSSSNANVYNVYIFSFDAATLLPTGDPIVMPNNDYSMFASETAEDNATQTVYGEFFSQDGQKMELCTVDYATQKRTVIGTIARTYVAMGITSDGQLYGIGVDGNLYKIDKTNASDALVGNTGVQVANENGGFYFQTGEIDQTNDKFYWWAVDSALNKGLYTVNLSTGKATRITSQNAQVVSMLLPFNLASDGAPAAVTGVKATFEGPSLTGTLSFTAPLTTYNGKLLGTEDLTYNIVANGEQVASGTCKRGEDVTTNVTVPAGLTTFTVTTTNNVGPSPKSHLTVQTGYDVPEAPSQVTFAIDSATGSSSVNWTEATKVLNGGYMGNMTYNVTRIAGNDTTEVATGLTTTHFSESLKDIQYSFIRYRVTAVNGDQFSTTTESNSLIYGRGIDTPYFDDLLPGTEPLWTIIDANNDGKVWHYSEQWTCFWSPQTSSVTNDDWLISPPIRLKGGRSYFVDYYANRMNSYEQLMEVKLGTDKTASAMTTTVRPTFVVPVDGMTHDTVKVASTGDYYFGFHDQSLADKHMITFDSLSIEVVPLNSSPDSVTQFEVISDPSGDLSAQVKFVSPVYSCDSSLLSTDKPIRIVVQLDGKTIKEITDSKPGKAETISNVGVKTNDFHKFEVFTYYGEEPGRHIAKRVFIGQDIPQQPVVKSITDHKTSVTMTWNRTPTIGANGRVVNPAKTFYIPYNVDESGLIRTDLPLDTISDTTYTFQYNTDEGDQKFKYWAVAALNSAGLSKAGSSQLIVGAPYTLPFRESFSNGTLDNGFMWQYRPNTRFTLGYLRTRFVDGDGACNYFRSNADNVDGSLNTGKITLKGSANPQLIYSYWVKAKTDGKIVIEVQTPDGKVQSIDSVIMTPGNQEAQWIKARHSLSQFRDAEYIFVKWHVYFNKRSGEVDLDNINIADVKQNDLSATVSAQQQVVAGMSFPASVTVNNIGANDAEGYSVSLFANGKLVGTQSVNDTLGYFESKTFSFSVPSAQSDHTAKAINLTAEVTYNGDDDAANNTATTSTSILQTLAPAPTELKLTKKDNAIGVDWTAAKAKTETVTDGFENYNPWLTAFGEWSTLDIDNGYAQSIFTGIETPFDNKKFAFVVTNPDSIYPGLGGSDSRVAPHSGSQYVSAIKQWKGMEHTMYSAGNNWLISPMLSGDAQTVTFWAHNVNGVNNYSGKDIVYREMYEVYYSTSVSDTSGMKNFVGRDTLSDGEWKKVEIDLPAGAKFFGIHHVTPLSTGRMFAVDDVTYTAGTGNPVSYNVYRNGQLVGRVDADGVLHLDDAVGDSVSGNVTYSVTAVYWNGKESAPISATIKLTVDGVAALSVGCATAYGGKGAINIANAEGKRVIVCDVAGRIYYNGNGSQTMIVNVPSGQYIVNIAGKNLNLIVR